MSTIQDDDQYHITDEDIEKVIDLLKITKPEKATPWYAKLILERLHARTKTLEQVSPESIEEILKDLEEN